MEWCAKTEEHLLDLPLSELDQSHMHSVIDGHHHDHLNHWLQSIGVSESGPNEQEVQ